MALRHMATFLVTSSMFHDNT